MATMNTAVKAVMKTNFKFQHGLIFCLGFSVLAALGHDVPVHRKITENAADSAANISTNYLDFLDAVSSDVSIGDARNSLSQGSAHEDDPVSPNPPIDGAG